MGYLVALNSGPHQLSQISMLMWFSTVTNVALLHTHYGHHVQGLGVSSGPYQHTIPGVEALGQSINQLIDQSINQLINHSISINWSINNRSIHRSINQSINWPIDQSINQSISLSLPLRTHINPSQGFPQTYQNCSLVAHLVFKRTWSTIETRPPLICLPQKTKEVKN